MIIIIILYPWGYNHPRHRKIAFPTDTMMRESVPLGEYIKRMLELAMETNLVFRLRFRQWHLDKKYLILSSFDHGARRADVSKFT